jgi:hypothetical protein
MAVALDKWSIVRLLAALEHDCESLPGCVVCVCVWGGGGG